MNGTRIAELVAELDLAVPKDGAAVILQQYGGGPDESRIVGNQLGYLRLGVELLKCGVTGQGDPGASYRAALDLRYLLSEHSDIGFDEFELSEAVSLQPSPPRRGSGIILGIARILLALTVLGVIGLAIVGLVSLFQ